MNLLKLAWKNITHRPLNLVLSMVLFGLGVGLIILLLLLNSQMKNNFDRNLADIDMVIGAKGSPLQMILCSMYHIDNPTGNITVGEAKPFLNPNHPLIKTNVPLSLGDSYKSHRIVGTNHDILKLYDGKIESGVLWENDFEVTIGKSVAMDLGLKLGDKFQSSHGFDDADDMEHEHGSFKVVGILEPTGSVLDQLILCNLASIWETHDHEAGGHDDHEGHDHSAHAVSNFNLLDHPDKDITSILVQFKSRTNFQALNMPRNINENTDMQAASPAIEINRLYSMIGIGVDALRNLAIIIALVSAFSIFISLFTSLAERKYELALMRVMGASPGKLFFLIILEGMVLAFFGFLVGLIISHVGMEVLASYAKSSYRYSFTGKTFLNAEWWILLASLAIGFVAAIIPAIQAYKTDIHNTLSK